jgi:hypothetical protein
MNVGKEKCHCGDIAVWSYMPGTGYYCDNCVSRGCECNHRYLVEEHDNAPTPDDELIKWIIPGKVWARVDDQGREFPCGEYDYSEEGFDINEQDNRTEILL